MGHEIVGDVPAEDLFAAAMARLAEEADKPPDLDRKAGEFGYRDARERYGWDESYTVRALERLWKAGKLDRAKRYDTETKREVWGYWWVE